MATTENSTVPNSKKACTSTKRGRPAGGTTTAIGRLRQDFGMAEKPARTRRRRNSGPSTENTRPPAPPSAAEPPAPSASGPTEPHKNNPFKNNVATEESHPSVRALSYRVHLAHDAMYERLAWLSRRLEAQGLEELAHHCAVWSREHATAAAVLRKRAR